MPPEMPLPNDLSLDPRFSPSGMQIEINSSSLGPFKACPRKYYYAVLWGWRTREAKVDLAFGSLVHEGIGEYEKCRISWAHEESMLMMVDWAMQKTWNPKLKRGILTEDNIKNRMSLIRTLIWYADQFGQDGGLETIRAADGHPMIEQRFRFASGLETKLGEPISFYGTLDRLVMMNSRPYVLDTKTTKFGLGESWFAGFSPDNQFSLYLLAARVTSGLDIKELILDGIQVGVNFSRCQRGLVTRDEAQLEEWLEDAGGYIESMERCVTKRYWPQNDRSCGMYGGCEFRSICSASPASREFWLNKLFIRERRETPKVEEAEVANI